MYIPKGFSVVSVYAGISKKISRPDMALWFSEKECTSAGMFTTNRVQAAPVVLSKKHLAQGTARAIFINAGCANAATGTQGLADARRIAALVAQKMHIDQHQVLVASTGVIGVRLPMKKIIKGIEQCAHKIVTAKTNAYAFKQASRAIMTTDTFPKITSRRIYIQNKPVHIWGCAKGAGMIHPDMATLLAVIITDASLSSSTIFRILHEAVSDSFNCISVDGDTSTNDTVFLLANGCAGNDTIQSKTKTCMQFQRGVSDIAHELAYMIAEDGEGAHHAITLVVERAKTRSEAIRIARTVATSPLVKTAICGMDPNWGRIIAAVGRSGIPINPDRIDIWIGTHQVCRKGIQGHYNKKKLKHYLTNKHINIRIILNQGTEQCTFHTCDLTKGYIDINAHYRT